MLGPAGRRLIGSLEAGGTGGGTPGYLPRFRRLVAAERGSGWWCYGGPVIARAAPMFALALAALSGCRAPAPPQTTPVSPVGVVATPRAGACKDTSCRTWAAILLSGGRDREDNVVAHERNVAFASRSLVARGVMTAEQTVLFADGDDTEADLQVEEPDHDRWLLLYSIGLLRGGDDARTAVLRYRDHVVPGAKRGDHAAVLQALADDARGAVAAPRRDLFLYVTDHGLEQPDRTNNLIVLWGRRDLSVRELGAALDAQPPARRVVTVMAQCFSGSFSALVHEAGDPKRSLAIHDRCGFFAAPADRPAAGCSPKSDESLYDDYTTRFFAALGGKDRAGAPIPTADLDGDGRVSLEEAHLWAVVHEATQDVPVTSSEELLRRSRPAWVAEAKADERPIGEHLAHARPTVRVAAQRLLASIGLDASVSIRSLRRLAGEIRASDRVARAEERARVARQAAHAALAREAGGTPLPDGPAGLALVVLGHARVSAWRDGARPALDASLAAEAEAERARVDVEEREARHLRLARLAELSLLERRAETTDAPLARDAARVRSCEATTM